MGKFNQKLSMNAIATMKLLACMLVWLWRIPAEVRGTGGIMGTVVSLVDTNYGNLTTVCALESGTLVPVCMGDPVAGTPTTQAMWALTAGEEFICGLKYDSHTPICWGGYVKGTSIPAAYTSSSYSTISAGRRHVCAVRDNSTLSPGSVDCWGDGTYNQLLPPKNVPMLSVASGDYFTCGIIIATKKVLCWGIADTLIMPSPPSDEQFKDIFSGRFHMCGIRLDGYTECWSGIYSLFTNPYPVSLFASIAGTYFYTCAIQQPSHQMKCWSPLNNYWPPPLPYAIASLSASAAMNLSSNGTAEFGYICAVREDIEVGNLYCFGTFPISLASSMSSFSASKGICRDQCPEGQYPVLTDGQCPNPGHKVCLNCNGECPLNSAPPPVSPSGNISNTTPSIGTSSSSSPISDNTTASFTRKVAVPICISLGCVVVIVILIAFVRVRYKCGIFRQGTKQEGSALIIFSPRQLESATDQYKEENIIGRGGFGVVYKGILKTKQIVAIKKPRTLEGGGDYEVELDMISRLDHPSLLKLIGYCKKNNALVFPFMEHGSLQDRMVDPLTRRTLSNTRLRLKIALQVAKGLDYMHKSNVIHRDIKTANILLDASWNAHISDFGISRVSLIGDKTQYTGNIVGTPGYVDPTFQRTGQYTSKSDVYSFGVVLLELACGLPPLGLAINASSLYAEGRLSELVDQNLLRPQKKCRLNLLTIAISCVKDSRDSRPSMDELVQSLETLQTKL